jgi:hypothetical protein
MAIEGGDETNGDVLGPRLEVLPLVLLFHSPLFVQIRVSLSEAEKVGI